MEVEIELTLQIPEEALCTQFKQIFQSMADEELGEALQERFDVFGEAAAAHLEEMLEEYEWGCFIASDITETGSTLSASFQTGADGGAFAEDFLKLMQLCGVQQGTAQACDDEEGEPEVCTLVQGVITYQDPED